ncbi:MAG: methyl-accepting chemotaxis protein, partial [Planctomycetota bacterium]
MKLVHRFKSLGLATRIVGIVLVVLVTVVTVNYVVFVRGYRASAERAMVDKAAAFTATADAAKDYAAEKLLQEGAFDKQHLLENLEQVLAEGRSYREAKIFGTLPVVVGWQSAGVAAEKENLGFKITSFDARNPDNEPASGTFDAQLLTDLKAQAHGGGGDTISRVNPDDGQLHYMRAIRLSQDCMTCHGDPASSPTGDGRDMLGFPMENWKVGDIHGAYHVEMPMAPVQAQVASFVTTGLMWTVPMIAGASFLFIVTLSLMFGRPVRQLIDRVRDIAEGEGDLTKRIALNRNDEIGQLSNWFDKFMDNLQGIIRDVAGATGEV